MRDIRSRHGTAIPRSCWEHRKARNGSAGSEARVTLRRDARRRRPRVAASPRSCGAPAPRPPRAAARSPAPRRSGRRRWAAMCPGSVPLGVPSLRSASGRRAFPGLLRLDPGECGPVEIAVAARRGNRPERLKVSRARDAALREGGRVHRAHSLLTYPRLLAPLLRTRPASPSRLWRPSR